MDFDQLLRWVKKNQMVAYPALAVVGFVLISFLLLISGKTQERTVELKGQDHQQIGLQVGGIDDKAYLDRLDKKYFELEEQLKNMSKAFKSMGRMVKDTQQLQKEIKKSISSLDKSMDGKLADLRNETNERADIPDRSRAKDIQLDVAEIQPVQEHENEDTVYLPLGSFCKGTLLTGVYATADQNNPLPVLITLDEAFWGPNKTRIPLKGAFVLGKAYGDLVSQRALIQIIAISSVLPDGVTFEKEENLGYVTDDFGELGIRGELVRHTGQQLAATFVSGFMAGGSQALADQEITTRVDGQGDTVKQFTGNSTKNAVFQGLAKSAGQLSEHYAQEMEKMVPAIHISNGQQVYFILQKGVSINGYSRLDLASGRMHD